MSDDLNLDALAAAVAAMTKAPWHACADGDLITVAPGRNCSEHLCYIAADVDEQVNADGIVALRNAAPALLARARRADELEKEVTRLRRELQTAAETMAILAKKGSIG